MTVSSEIHGKFIYSLPYSRKESGAAFKIQKYSKHEIAQIKIGEGEDKGEEEEKRLGTQNRVENKQAKSEWATNLRTGTSVLLS